MASRGTCRLLPLCVRNHLSKQRLQDLKPIPLPEWRRLVHTEAFLVGRHVYRVDYKSRKSSSPGPPTRCPSSEFQCRSYGCLNFSLVCNGKEDCADGSDEGGRCSSPSCRQAQCSHTCYRSPHGPVSSPVTVL